MKRMAMVVCGLSLLLVVTLVIVSGCGGGKDTLKIGVIVPTTGDAATYGNNTRKGAELALEEAKKRGDFRGLDIQLLVEDSKGEAKSGVAAINKLTSVDNVVAIVDDCVSSVALAIVPIADRNQIPVVSSGSTNPKLSGISKYFCRVWNSDMEEGAFSAKYATSRLHCKRGAILYINNDYGKGLRDVFEKQFQVNKGSIVGVESFDQGTASYRAQISKLAAAAPDCFYIVGYSSDLPILLRQIRESGTKATILGTVTMEDSAIVKGAGSAANGVYYPYAKEPVGTVVADFRRTYEAKYNEKPGIASDTGFDAAAVILESIAKGARTGPEIQKELSKIRAHAGASGDISFDQNGDVHKPMVMKAIRGGKFVVVP